MSTPADSTFYLLPDLVLGVFLIASTLLGAHSGFLRTLLSLAGRLASVLGAAWLARAWAPGLAAAVVTPAVGSIFAERARTQLAPVESAMDALEASVTQAAVSMAEGVAFLLLLFVGAVLISFALRALGAALSLVVRVGPLSMLNRLAGAALGFAGGIVLSLIVLALLHALSPALFEPLGALAPERIEQTVLLRSLLTFFPIV